MKKLIFNTLLLTISALLQVQAEDIPILSYTVDSYGCAQIQVKSSPEYYYVLYCKPSLNEKLEWATSIKLGQAGTTTISEGLKAYPKEHYRVTRYLKNTPNDTDGDGIDDMEELAGLGGLAPLNPATDIGMENGAVCIPDKETFEKLSYQGEQVSVDHHLKDLVFVKFFIINIDSPKVYFMNTKTHRAHTMFAKEVGIERDPSITMRGEIIYHPTILAPNGRLGVYRFEFEPNDSYLFNEVQACNEFLVANIPFLRNNWVYYPMPNHAQRKYYREQKLYNASRVAILLESDVYSTLDYMPLHKAEGFGLLKKMNLDERPNTRDIVLYEALPNEMPRVGGIITSVPQTPLSHVNLRAIQDNVPNAYIAGAPITEKITKLIGKYIYFKVEDKSYEIRQATLQEVDSHYKALRPEQTQYPTKDLSNKKITPLSEIDFSQSTTFGVKAANLASMLKFGFPKGTIPEGFAVPFYFYDAFMKYNNFYNDIEAMLSNPDFQNDYNVQETMLNDFRKTIKTGQMPKWMTRALNKMHKSFPQGTPIRCRSSTNNEDLQGFSGAGLYDSKTQKPDEGHISKSIKQVYASLWNFRAFDERQFYKIDHLSVAMGVLCHPNYSDEKANGVGVSTDPIYKTNGTYYLNTQLGEDLVTNPESLSIPEEIILHTKPKKGNNYSVIRTSNMVAENKKLMSEEQLKHLQNYLGIIETEFKKLYKAQNQPNFAMEIEYKITQENRLIIKQARPWITNTAE